MTSRDMLMTLKMKESSMRSFLDIDFNRFLGCENQMFNA